MKILMLTPYLPYPLYSGGQIRTYNLLANLSKSHQITLYSFIRNSQEKRFIPKLSKFCIDVQVFLKRPPWSFTSMALAGITFYPLVVCMYLNNELKRTISYAIKREQFDLIHAETFYVMPNIPDTSIPIILAEQTIEYLVYKHFTESVPILPKKILMNWDVAKIYFWEKRFWQKASHVVAMSESDRQVMHKHNPMLKVDLVPNGVDTTYFQKKGIERSKKGQTILFVGNFKWLQNQEAVAILLQKIWPIIQKRLPYTKLWIVGRYPPRIITQHAGGSIKISDNIDDIRMAYQSSDALLAPIYGPGGTRYKILESMATGLPVVTTPTGIEGLGATHEVDALIASSPQALANETIRLLTTPLLYKKLALNGRKLVERKFNWQIIASRLDTIYKQAANEKND